MSKKSPFNQRAEQHQLNRKKRITYYDLVGNVINNVSTNFIDKFSTLQTDYERFYHIYALTDIKNSLSNYINQQKDLLQEQGTLDKNLTFSFNKSEEKAKEKRLQGNEWYKSGNFPAALRCYNEAVVLARWPNGEGVLSSNHRKGASSTQNLNSIENGVDGSFENGSGFEFGKIFEKNTDQRISNEKSSNLIHLVSSNSSTSFVFSESSSSSILAPNSSSPSTFTTSPLLSSDASLPTTIAASSYSLSIKSPSSRPNNNTTVLKATNTENNLLGEFSSTATTTNALKITAIGESSRTLNDNVNELSLSLANRSAVFWQTGRHLDCIEDIDRAIASNYSTSQLYKLLERKLKCLVALKQSVKARECYKNFEKSLILSTLKEGQKVKLLDECKKVMLALSTVNCIENENSDNSTSGNSSFNDANGNKFTTENSCFDKTGPKSCTRAINNNYSNNNSQNNKYSKTSFEASSMQFIREAYNEQEGRHMVAKEDLLTGQMIMSENTKARVLHHDCFHRRCYQCFAQLRTGEEAIFSCRICSSVSFCSENCRKLSCDKKYGNHGEVECCLLPFLLLAETGNLARLALRIALMLHKKEKRSSPNDYHSKANQFLDLNKVKLSSDVNQNIDYLEKNNISSNNSEIICNGVKDSEDNNKSKYLQNNKICHCNNYDINHTSKHCIYANTNDNISDNNNNIIKCSKTSRSTILNLLSHSDKKSPSELLQFTLLALFVVELIDQITDIFNDCENTSENVTHLSEKYEQTPQKQRQNFDKNETPQVQQKPREKNNKKQNLTIQQSIQHQSQQMQTNEITNQTPENHSVRHKLKFGSELLTIIQIITCNGIEINETQVSGPTFPISFTPCAKSTPSGPAATMPSSSPQTNIGTSKKIAPNFTAPSAESNCGQLLITPSSSSSLLSDTFPKSIGLALYPGISTFNHSCYPDVELIFSGSECRVRCLKPVKSGCSVRIDYGYLFYAVSKNERKAFLAKQYFFDCKCEACLGDWPTLKHLKAHYVNNNDKNSLERINLISALKQAENLKLGLETLSMMENFVNNSESLRSRNVAPKQETIKCMSTLKKCYRLMGNVSSSSS